MFVGAGLKSMALVAAPVAAGIGLVAANIIKTGANFEQQMATVGSVMLKGRNEIKDLEKRALDLGATTKFTATEAAQGMELMARAGFSNEDILSGIEGVLSAAAASGMDLAETAGHVSNVLKGMGKDTSEATNVADVLAVASSKTNSSIGSLGESMSNVGSTARQLKIPLEEVVAGVALLQDVGLDASVAGSAMNTMLTKLAKPTSAMKAKMKEMGVAFQDSKGNMLPLSEVMDNLAKGAEKSGGNMDQVAFFADLVGLRGQKAASNLADLFKSGKFNTLVEELKKAEGAAKKMADLRMDSLEGDFTLLGSAVDGFKTKLFQTQSGPLRDVVKSVTEWVNANAGLVVDNIDDWIEAVKPLATIFSDAFVKQITEVADAFGLLDESKPGEGFNAWNQTSILLAEGLGQLAALTVAVALAFSALAGGSIASLVLGFLLVKGALGGFIDFIGSVVFAVTDFFANLSAVFSAEGLSLSEKALKIGKMLVVGFAKGIEATAMLPINAVKAIGKGALDAIKTSTDTHSPSRAMERIGADLSAGLELGMAGGERGIEKAALGLAEAATMQTPAAQLGALNAEQQRRLELHGMFSPRRRGDENESGETSRAPAFTPSVGPSLVGAQVARSVEERLERIEIAIHDESGSAEITKGPSERSGVKLTLQQTGAF